MPLVKSNGINLYYETHGAGEPLLLIMGLGANATNWEAQVGPLSKEFQVIAFDNRGSGRSEKPLEAYSIHQMAEDAAGLMDALGIHSAHVFGMSMGGMIAQELVLRAPERVRSLILGGTLAGGPGAVFPSPATIQQFVALASIPMKDAIETGLRFFYSENYIRQHKVSLIARSLKYAALMPPPHAMQKQVMAVIGFNSHSRLPQVKVPALILHGTDDMIVPFPNSAVLKSRIAGSRKIDYPGAGHGFLTECAAEVNDAVLGFLREHRTHFVAAAQ